MIEKESTGEELLSYAAPNPNRFYIFDNNFQKVKKTLFAHQIFDRPTYALVGPTRDVKARIVSLMYPTEIKINEPTDTWIVALTGGNINNPPSKHLSQVIVTNNYTLIEPSTIWESSSWRISEPTYLSFNKIFLIKHPSHSVHYSYNAYNLLSAEIDAIQNNGGDKLIVSHILLPSFIRELDIEVFQHLYVIGYRPGIDGKFSLLEQIQPILIDESLLYIKT